MLNKVIPVVVIISVFFTDFLNAQSSIKQVQSQHVNYGQDINKPLTNRELAFIQEVYGEAAEKYILNKPQRLKDIKHILRNRVEIILLPNKNLTSFPLLSQIPLFDAYNSGLTRTFNGDVINFNPLKYEFDFYSKKSIKVRIDNTQYLIIIKSQFE